MSESRGSCLSNRWHSSKPPALSRCQVSGLGRSNSCVDGTRSLVSKTGGYLANHLLGFLYQNNITANNWGVETQWLDVQDVEYAEWYMKGRMPCCGRGSRGGAVGRFL
eukprot:1162124-Pelagomonas_calceolata.AAC.3